MTNTKIFEARTDFWTYTSILCKVDGNKVKFNYDGKYYTRKLHEISEYYIGFTFNGDWYKAMK